MSDEKKPQERVGVYICHCGTNIAGVVNVGEVSEWAGREMAKEGVVIARDYKFMCSSLGQELIQKDESFCYLTFPRIRFVRKPNEWERFRWKLNRNG
jgi:hypothetical protein